jgi:hypothetical protein
MNPLAKSVLRELKRDGIVLDPVDDLHHISAILSLADRALRVQTELHTKALLYPSKRVGSLVLRRLSIGVNDFLREEVDHWFDPDTEDAVLSWAYCYANGHKPDPIFESRGNLDAWKKVLRDWRKSLDVSMIELIAAIQDFQLTDELTLKELQAEIEARQKVQEDDPASYGKNHGTLGPVLDRLIAEYGKDVHSWIWETPAEEVELLIDAFMERDEADRIRNAPAGKAVAGDPDGVFRRTFRKIRLYVELIKREKAEKCPDPASLNSKSSP